MNEMSPSGEILAGLFFYRIRRGEIEFVWGSSRTVARVAAHKIPGHLALRQAPADLNADGRKGPTWNLYLSAAYIHKTTPAEIAPNGLSLYIEESHLSV